MLKTNKGSIAPQTLGELIILIAGGLIVIFILLAVLGGISPVLGSFGCALNVRIFGAFVSATSGLMTPPIFLCNQYNEPVKINAADFSKCPDLADFCKKEKDPAILTECYRQCARIQVDKLTDACWMMGGSGKVHLWTFGATAGANWQTFSAIFSGSVNVVGCSFFGWIPKDCVFLQNYWLQRAVSSRATVLKCFKFQITNPVIDPNGKQIQYEDASLGRSWIYTLDNSELCKRYKTEENPICSYGGTGVSYVNELGPGSGRVNLFGKELKYPSNEDEFRQNARYGFLNYNATPRQVCYIAYYNDGGADDFKYVIRSCSSWGAGAGWVKFLN
ncbi:MAG: hypothetical protein ACPLYW_01960 [Candidatus Nanoarchaeia archaeon]